MTSLHTLSPEHEREILGDSGVSADVAAARGYRTLTGLAGERQELEDLGFNRALVNRDTCYPALLIPMHGVTGEVRSYQLKPKEPRTRTNSEGEVKPLKYESPKGAALVVDVPAFTREHLHDLERSLWITEGCKKVDALVTVGMLTVGLTGVWNWRSKHGALGDWEDVPIKDRVVVVCFDADAAANRHVQQAMARLGAWLRTRGAREVKYVIVPADVNGTSTKGVDDFLAAGGTVKELGAVATSQAPGQGAKDAAFTDSFLVEDLAEDMEGRFCWASGIGWLRWNGQVWKEVSDVEPLEHVRVWASAQFDKVLAEQRKNQSADLGPKIAGWRAILGKPRLTALRDLSRGLIQRDAAEFDGNPDLLTVKNGTVHLPSGELRPFDPEDLSTKQADAEYRPGATHPMWTKALQAIPAELHEWYQDRMGQALSGYPIPDHMMVVAHGTGSNGKSTVVDVFRKTVGDYGVIISDRVLMASPDAHPTELMDLRGARYAVLEETPEARQLNVQRLKMVLGTPSIKARRMRQDPVEFLTSHSLFINTNYKPVITETDWGTWRRLSLLTFPFTFRKPGVALSGPFDREGDGRLAYAANDPDVRAAALAWMVDGARRWYARDRMMLPMPQGVEDDTRAWRAETDLILGFVDDVLRFDVDAFTQTADMLAAFNEWAAERGHRPWTDRTFASRFSGHETVAAAKVRQGRFRIAGKQQRGWAGVSIRKGDDPWDDLPPEPPAPAPAAPELPQGYQDVAVSEVVRAEPEEPNTNNSPVSLGFDLETASVKELYTGKHAGPFVRLAGAVDSDGTWQHVGPMSETYLEELDRAGDIYGANIFGFDLQALAHHHGADYDALAAKAWDINIAERLIDPPGAKGVKPWGANGYYGLDQIAQRYGVEGKTHDLKALAERHGGYDKIPVNDPEYNDYLRGDLAATAATKARQDAKLDDLGMRAYVTREMRVQAILNRMSLNGWKVDVPLLAQRVAEEQAKVAQAVAILNQEFGMPLAKPDRFKLKPKAEWPEAYRRESVTDARAMLAENPERMESLGVAERIPGEVSKAPWATTEGRMALMWALKRAGATAIPRTPGGDLALSSDALGPGKWFCSKRGKSFDGLLELNPGNAEVARLAETIVLATGARKKYAEIQGFVTEAGRVHPELSGSRPDDGNGTDQAAGRFALAHPSLTNMGMRGAAGQERAVLIADDGEVLLTADLSQVDMRAMAAMSQDPAYMALFAPGRDAHMEMAQVYFGVQNAETRQKTKAFNHAGNYGQGAKAVSERTGIPLEVCYDIQRAKEDAYPTLTEYIRQVREEAESGRLLDNGFGRKMRPDPLRAHTQGPALIGQGAARDIMCESLLRLKALRPDFTRHLRGVVHDEVVLSIPEGEAAEWAEALREAFTWEWRGVPILCEVGKPARRWSDCK